MARGLATVAFVLVSASVALGQPNGKVTDQQMAQAKDIVNKAKEKSNAGDHQGAADLYLQAYQIAPLPLLLSNVAAEFEKMPNKSVEAIKYYCKYLEAEPDGPMAGYATQHTKELQIAMKNPVDDKNVCAPPKTAVVTTPVDTTPKPPPPPPVKPVAATDPAAARKRTGMIVAGVGALSVGAGLIFGAKAQSISDSITNHDIHMPWPDDIRDQQAAGERDQTLQIIFLGAGAAAIAGGAYLYLTAHGKTGGEHMAVHPVATPSYSGVSLSGHF